MFSGPFTALPTSRTLIGAPLRYATMTSFQAPVENIWSLLYTVTLCAAPSNEPFGALTVAVASCARTSSSARPKAAIFGGSICTRIAGFCAPERLTCPTPDSCEIC